MTAGFDAPVFADDLIRKYDVAGPRYTSYPTAPHFHEGFDAAAYAENVRRTTREHPADLSIYVHLPFCRHACYFCACNTIFTKDRGAGDRYVGLLEREMDLVRGLMATVKPVRQLHWGGGTPTFSPPETLERLILAITERFPLADDAEASIEVDPRETTPRHLEVLAARGFNRLSLGIQDFDPAVQKAVHRVQPYEMTRGVIDAARAAGFTGVNVDLVYGLPRQAPETFGATVERVVSLRPDRIALFNFAYLPEMFRHQRVLKPGELPAPPVKLEILKLATRLFTAAGYVFIGMDHFARPDDELAVALRDRTLTRNFQGYTTRAGLDLYAFGVTSISQIGRTYSQNVKDLAAWGAAVEAGRLPVQRGVVLTDDDVLRRDVILSLMCHFVLVKSEIEARHGIRFDERFAAELESLRPLEADGLLRTAPDRIEVLPAGRLLVRNIAMNFDAYLKADGPGRFSRTV